MNIGKRIKEIRVKNNVTQRELAEKLGLTLNTVSRYETGERRPRIDTVIKIAKALDVEPSDLFTGEQRAFYELFDNGYGDEWEKAQENMRSNDNPFSELSSKYTLLNKKGKEVINEHIEFLSQKEEYTAPDSSTASDHEEGEGADKTDTPR